jgi:hypothetical protein
VPIGLPRLRHLMPWSIVGLGLLAACLLALVGPFGQSQCTGWTGYLPVGEAQLRPGPAPLGSYAIGVQLCTNVVFRGAFYGVP